MEPGGPFGNIYEAAQEAEDAASLGERLFNEQNNEANRGRLLEAQNLLQVRQPKTDFWQQKARIRWNNDDNKNSKYFQACVQNKGAKLFINKTIDPEGNTLLNNEYIRKEAIDYFTKLYSKEVVHLDESLLEAIPQLITEDDNTMLNAPALEQEIWNTIKAMDPDNVAGTNGFNGHFLISCWNIIKVDIVEVVRAFLEGLQLPKAIANTLLNLIPKGPNPSSFADYLPISLCNFSNKVTSKLISTRLAPLLPKLTSFEQSGFCSR